MLSSMKSALGISLGVLVSALAFGCGSSSNTGTGGPKPVGNAGTSTSSAGTTTGASGSSTGTGGSGTGGSGDVTPVAGVPLTIMDGWVDGMSNTLMIQGAMFEYADEHTKAGPPALMATKTGDKVCITGTAAMVDLKCTPMPPATDCYGEFWGAAIGLNMHQEIGADGMGGDPMPFDASAIKGFAFTIDGTAIPDAKSFRFKVEGGGAEYCNTGTTVTGAPMAKAVKMGENSFMFDDLITSCWKPVAGAPTATTTKASVLKIAWQVVTNDKSKVPFDFCVSNVRAITE